MNEDLRYYIRDLLTVYKNNLEYLEKLKLEYFEKLKPDTPEEITREEMIRMEVKLAYSRGALRTLTNMINFLETGDKT
jgi:hypothetical protein